MSNILYIRNGTKVKTHNNAIIVELSDNIVEVPVCEVSSLIIESLQCTITAAVNVLCNSNNIPIIYCDNKYNPVAISTSFNTYYNPLTRLNDQIAWTESQKSKLYTKIIKQKCKINYPY